jgi:hypothetical protein
MTEIIHHSQSSVQQPSTASNLVKEKQMADKKIVVNCTTGEVTEVELTAEEVTQREADRIAHVARKVAEDAAKVAKATAKKDAVVKVLSKLGVTEDEFKLIFSKE